MNEIETKSHSEKDIVNSCISLMQKVFDDMIDYMEYLGVEFEDLSQEELPQLNYSYFKIVQNLLLSQTSHSGGTSTMEKCEELGFDCSDDVTLYSRKILELIEEKENESEFIL